MRTLSPSRYSTISPRRSSSGPTRCAMVVLPEPDSPVNQRVKPPGRTSGVSGCSAAKMFSVIFLLFRFDVNPALELVRAGPAAGALFLVGRGRPRAGDAADRAITGLV